jgi:hypothetical protein
MKTLFTEEDCVLVMAVLPKKYAKWVADPPSGVFVVNFGMIKSSFAVAGSQVNSKSVIWF